MSFREEAIGLRQSFRRHPVLGIGAGDPLVEDESPHWRGAPRPVTLAIRSMGTIEHLLCTHCTFGTSALESATADNAGKVLGYSTRASSIRDRAKLREEFRAVERLLSYELPSDSTSEHKKQLDASTAPVRLCFLPDIAGRQVVGQVSYRQLDTANRPGSYFAHLLVAPAANAWPVLDCLRLWGISDPSGCGGWADSDSQAGFPDVSPLPSLTTWLDSDRAWLDDSVAAEFVRTGTSGKRGSPATSIPSRWANTIEETDRLGLIAAILQTLLVKRVIPAVVMAVEPQVAAVCFYAALRLLPAKLRTGVGFSTYEHDPAKAPTRLAATTFLGTGSDFKPQIYQGESLVINTFRGPPFVMGSYKASPGIYAKWATQRLAKGDLARVDELSRTIEKVWTTGAPSAAEMDQIIALEDYRSRLFRGQAVALPADLTGTAHRFLAVRCSQKIRANIADLARLPAASASALLKKLEAVFLPTPQEWEQLKRHPEVVTWVRTAQPLDENGVLEKLSQPATILPDSDAVQLIASCECVTKDRRLPLVSPKSRRLWGEPSSLQSDADYAVQPLLLKLLESIEPAGLSRLLPRPLPHLRAVLAIARAIQMKLESLPGNGILDTPQHKHWKGHLRHVFDDAAGGGSSEQQPDTGLSTNDFEALLEELKPCDNFVDREPPGLFGARVSGFVKGLRNRPADVCVDKRLILLASRWAQYAEDHKHLGELLEGWKQLLSWFARMDTSGKGKDSWPFTGHLVMPEGVPFAKQVSMTTDTIKDITCKLVPGSDERRKAFLMAIYDAYVRVGWLERPKGSGFLGMFANSASLDDMTSRIDKMFSPPKA